MLGHIENFYIEKYIFNLILRKNQLENIYAEKVL